MKRLGGALLPLVLIGAIAADGCGTSTTSSTTVSMTSNNFVQHAVTIRAGSQLQFVDPADTGGVHILCFGHDVICAPNPKGPAEFNVADGRRLGGIEFDPGDSKSFTFANPGTYEVTCLIHEHMNVTITVQ